MVATIAGKKWRAQWREKSCVNNCGKKWRERNGGNNGEKKWPEQWREKSGLDGNNGEIKWREKWQKKCVWNNSGEKVAGTMTGKK